MNIRQSAAVRCYARELALPGSGVGLVPTGWGAGDGVLQGWDNYIIRKSRLLISMFLFMLLVIVHAQIIMTRLTCMAIGCGIII